MNSSAQSNVQDLHQDMRTGRVRNRASKRRDWTQSHRTPAESAKQISPERKRRWNSGENGMMQ